MRLIDDLAATAASPGAMRGMFRAFTSELARAEVFELMPDVVEACKEVLKSKPSSIVQALSLARAPYQHMWVEWAVPRVPGAAENVPRRVGFMIEAENGFQRGVISWAWSHEGEGPSPCPLGCRFDWHPMGDVVAEGTSVVKQAAELLKELPSTGDAQLDAIIAQMAKVARPPQNIDRLGAKKALSATASWKRFDTADSEIAAIQELGRHMQPFVPHWAVPTLVELRMKAGEAMMERAATQWLQDLEGEPIFALAVIVALNSRNMLELAKEDLSRLNRSRVKSRKLPLRECVETRLSLSRRLRGREEVAAGAAAVRQHLVRGHFKVRRSGIYWWSPHVRGKGSPAPRIGYTVFP